MATALIAITWPRSAEPAARISRMGTSAATRHPTVWMGRIITMCLFRSINAPLRASPNRSLPSWW